MSDPQETKAVDPSKPRLLTEDADAATVDTPQGQQVVKTNDRKELAEKLEVEEKDI